MIFGRILACLGWNGVSGSHDVGLRLISGNGGKYWSSRDMEGYPGPGKWVWTADISCWQAGMAGHVISIREIKINSSSLCCIACVML